jgi:hypothetical protein
MTISKKEKKHGQKLKKRELTGTNGIFKPKLI